MTLNYVKGVRLKASTVRPQSMQRKEKLIVLCVSIPNNLQLLFWPRAIAALSFVVNLSVHNFFQSKTFSFRIFSSNSRHKHSGRKTFHAL